MQRNSWDKQYPALKKILLMAYNVEKKKSYSPGDIHFWIYDDVTDNCILDLRTKISIRNRAAKCWAMKRALRFTFNV